MKKIDSWMAKLRMHHDQQDGMEEIEKKFLVINYLNIKNEHLCSTKPKDISTLLNLSSS